MKMKPIILFFALFMHIATQAQNVNIAETAPKGILVLLGTKIPNGVKAQSVKIEKKEAGSDFRFLSEVKSPASEADFLAKVNDNKRYFPDTKAPSAETLSKAWKTAARTGSLDSVGYVGRIPFVRIALGLCYYDLDVKEKTGYQYRITINSNGSAETYTSNSASYPLHPKFDDAVLNEFDFSKKGLYIRWKSVGKNPAVDFKAIKYVEKKPVEATGDRSQYTVRDTTYYVFMDRNAAAGKNYQYTLVGLDKYGNTAYGSTPAVITTTDFNSVYFKTSNAKRNTNSLGIQLAWRLNDASNIQSVHVYRSTDALKNFTETGSVKGSDTTFTDANIIPDKTYYYYLTARDRTGKEVIRSSAFFESGMDANKPLVPQLVSAMGIKNGVKLVCIVPDKYVTGIKVYRADGASDRFEVISDFYATRDSDRVEFIDSSKSLSGRNTYSYYIVSMNTSNLQSEKSNVMQAQPGIPTEPASPGFLRAYFQDDVINLAWMDMRLNDPLVQGYIVSKRESGSGNWTNVFGTDSIFPGSQFEDSKFEEGKTYEYKIETVDEFGGKSKTAVTGQVNIPGTTVAPPAGLKAIALADGIELEWSPSGDENISGYQVYRYQRGSQPKKIGSTGAGVRNYLDKSAKKGELNFYYVTALDNRQRESEPSAEAGIRK